MGIKEKKEFKEFDMTEDMKLVDGFQRCLMAKGKFSQKEIISIFELKMMNETLKSIFWRLAVRQIPEFRDVADGSWKVCSKEGKIRLASEEERKRDQFGSMLAEILS